MDCLFCGIVEKKIPSTVVFEDEHTLAFLDIHPLAAGHTIIVPKKHASQLHETGPETGAQLGLTMKRVSDILHASLKPDGFTIGINDGVGGQQGVPHVHMHIIPRWQNDGGTNLHGIIKGAPRMSLEQVASLLQNKNL